MKSRRSACAAVLILALGASAGAGADGCNFIPSTAISQLEMWQAGTFDPATIDKELGFAERALTRDSLFETCLPIFKRYGVGAINWGLVKGKTNTIFAWNAPMPDKDEPPVWFHDLFRPDGTPFRPAEAEFIRTITKDTAQR